MSRSRYRLSQGARQRMKKRVFRSLWEFDPRCVWCRAMLTKRSATMEHIVPLADGGTHEMLNLALACAHCNSHRDGSERPHLGPHGRRWAEMEE